MKTKLLLLLLLCAQPAFGDIQLSMSPMTPINFGNVLVGTTSTKITITLTNDGTDTATIESIGLSPTNTVDFKVCVYMAPGCVAPAGSMDIEGNGGTLPFDVMFTPQSLGSKMANVEINDNDVMTDTILIALVGNGAMTPSATTLTVDMTPLAFHLSPNACNRVQEIQVSANGPATFEASLNSLLSQKFSLCVGTAAACAGTVWQQNVTGSVSGGGRGASTTIVFVRYSGNAVVSSGDSNGVDFKKDGVVVATVAVTGDGTCLQKPIIPDDVYLCRFPCFIWDDPWRWVINPQIWMTILILPIFVLSIATLMSPSLNSAQSKVLLGIVGLVAIAAGGQIGAAAVAVTTVAASVKALNSKVNARE